jgi:hypothetical protein
MKHRLLFLVLGIHIAAAGLAIAGCATFKPSKKLARSSEKTKSEQSSADATSTKVEPGSATTM